MVPKSGVEPSGVALDVFFLWLFGQDLGKEQVVEYLGKSDIQYRVVYEMGCLYGIGLAVAIVPSLRKTF